MDIYISDKSKKDEYIKFVKFWEEKWYPEIIKKLGSSVLNVGRSLSKE
ncbi:MULTISPECIES: hypothetical protein [Clostridium]|nr:hypothetical protein [[Clostridium] innocuum]MCC2847063.1 hypothetical protein [[Clostridium] innocuum]MCC2851181.1 hypothetical protein [[Clostridium] innocuum]MCC2855294.1 hypothetical protein [[Clostridium] innocuum]MCQ5280064.1 hypothetical protein [Clostridium sp. DFI.1.208]